MNHFCTSRFFQTLLFVFITTAYGYSQSVSIATWKNDKKAAYSIIHDDYGDVVVDGIWQYADTIAANRDIKFTIGAISSSCEASRNINGYADPYDYARNVMMDQHGHEIIAHSHTHSCAVGGATWSPCNSTGWADSDNFSTEIDYCTSSIENGTGHKPQYYIYPYDRFNNDANNKLKELGYIGSRSGWTSAAGESYHRDGYDANDLSTFYPDADGFFRTAVQVFGNEHTQMSDHDLILNEAVDNAIASGEWANRELHNVGGTGWGSVSLDGYTKHMDYVQEKINSNDLWVGTVSEILTYQIQKLKFEPLIDQTTSLTWDITWDTINPEYVIDFSTYFVDLDYTTPLTMKVDLNARTGNWSITQNGSEVEYEIIDRIFHIHVYPHLGDVTIELLNETFPAPTVVNPIPTQDLVGDFATLTFDLNQVFEDSNSVDATLIYSVTGHTGIDINLVGGIATVTSQFGWEGIDTVFFSAEDESGAIATDTVIFDVFGLNSPFYGTRFAIPASIEAEDFDLGGPLVAYLELDDYEINNYRPSTVDIKNDAGYTVLMESGEWMDYSIYVDNTGEYDITIFGRGFSNNSTATIQLDGQLLRTFDIVYTDDPLQMESNKLYNIQLDSGVYVLVIEANEKIEIDRIEISIPGANTSPFVENSIPNQELFINFSDYELQLDAYFEDIETLDEDLTYSVSGDVNISVTITDRIATVTSTSDWEGTNTIIFTAEDYNGALVRDTVTFWVSEDFARPNQSTVNNKGYMFTFEEENALQCEGTMIPHSSTNNPRNGYEIDTVGNGSLLITSDGTQFGTDHITLGFNNTCVETQIDLSHPDQRVIEVKVHSTVDVPQLVAVVTDENGVTADYDIETHALTAGQWHTLTFNFNDLRSWAGGVMDVTKLETISLFFRTNYNEEVQAIAGTFTIDYINIGNAVIPCPEIYIESEVAFDVTNDSTVVKLTAYGQNLAYQWYRDNEALTNDASHSGADAATLVINDFMEEDGGTYSCVLSDACGAMDVTSNSAEILWGVYYGDYTAIPAWIEAEDYDDKSSATEVRVASDTVVGTKLGGWGAGDWSEYKIYVPESKYYNLQLRMATASNLGDYALEVDGQEILRTMLSSTGGWEAWKTISHDIQLEKGEHTFRFYLHHGWFGLNWLNFETSTFTATEEYTELDLKIFPNPAHDEVHFSKSVSGTVSITDLQGRIVRSYVSDAEQSVKVSGLSNGVYILTLDSDTGSRFHTRFVKK